ncbi:MAG: transcription termination factor NusA [Bacillota bacterium]
MNTEFIEALEELEREKGIAMDVLIEALEAALISAYKRNFGSLQNVRVHIDRETGDIKVFARKTVVEKVEDDRSEITLEDARARDARYELEDIVEIEVTPRDFGRIAAQTAKQVVVQRIREAERGIIFEEFSSREGDIVTGIVQRQDQKNVYIDLGKTEAILAPTEQIPGEDYRHGDRIKTYIVEVRKTTKGPQILVSRTHPGLLKRLFELEVPEIHDGTVELKSVAREAGARSKIAVYSKDENVDPVGACVGPKGMRVQTIVSELKGEKIDIVKWSQDPAKFVANALSPAKVVSVVIYEDDKIARVVVPDYQLSLAIGKEGQNARLAAKLTGWKIDIKSESQMEALRQEYEALGEEGYYGEGYYGEGYEEGYAGEYQEGYEEGEYTEEDFDAGEYTEEGYDAGGDEGGEYAGEEYAGENAECDLETAETAGEPEPDAEPEVEPAAEPAAEEPVKKKRATRKKKED